MILVYIYMILVLRWLSLYLKLAEKEFNFSTNYIYSKTYNIHPSILKKCFQIFLSFSAIISGALVLPIIIQCVNNNKKQNKKDNSKLFYNIRLKVSVKCSRVHDHLHILSNYIGII